MINTIHKHPYNTICDCVHNLPDKFFDKKVLTYLKSLVLWWKKIGVAFSGWPDSVFLLMHILFLIINHHVSINKIIVFHYMHHVRKDDIVDITYMQSNISNIFQFCTAWYKWDDIRESTLREVRWDWICQISLLYNIDIVLTWHNMTDRIETTLLNAVRGSSIKWWNWMKQSSRSIFGTVNRPLLHISKQKIIKYLNQYECPYLLDPTNNDIHVSERNRIRKLLYSNTLSYCVYNNNRWTVFYEALERFHTVNPVSYYECSLAWFRGEWVLWRLTITKTTSIEEVILLCNSYLVVDNSVNNRRRKFILWTWLWYFKIWKYWILRTSWMFYFTTLRKFFWLSDNIELPKKLFWISDDIWRLPQKEDTYKWKPIHEWIKSQAVPIFWRNCLPVQWETHIIKKVYSLDSIQW